jgi:hypothetical protein
MVLQIFHEFLNSDILVQFDLNKVQKLFVLIFL